MPLSLNGDVELLSFANSDEQPKTFNLKRSKLKHLRLSLS